MIFKPSKSQFGIYIQLIVFITGVFAFQVSTLATPSYEHALPGTLRTAANIIPSRGNVRIPVIVVGTDTISTSLNDFFNNELDHITFRKYWRINSINKYDPRTFIIHSDAKLDNFPGEMGSVRAKTAAWKAFAAEEIQKLSSDNKINNDYFDTSGPLQIPDNWTDGMIIVAPGVEEPILVLDNEKNKENRPAIGPFIVIGENTSEDKILGAFASIMGFLNVEKNLCLSVFDSTDDLFMVDGYNRARAGWIEVVELDGPVKNIIILPSSTSESIYRIGKGKEYFLIEGRSAARGLDKAIRTGGIAVYHVDETSNAGEGKTRSGAPSITNVVPAGSNTCSPEDVLFRNNNNLGSDYLNQNPSVYGTLPTHMNWNTGEPSDLVILGIDVTTHFPIMTAVVGFQ